ncbi:hypothetical protein G8V03_13225 [Clostridium botulinum D/C]|nr:hypothetical protein [Clostridium botulinum]MCD3351946.1 hypothetical protein [Clostridium botulinum D/C]MCD3360881.1 hypothetical protein [Clostridium botulinum D/C]MCD3366621.1 hypothetical protein [Clostridium botulinum D/C]
MKFLLWGILLDDILESIVLLLDFELEESNLTLDKFSSFLVLDICGEFIASEVKLFDLEVLQPLNSGTDVNVIIIINRYFNLFFHRNRLL